jgi:hypothetical protein
MKILHILEYCSKANRPSANTIDKLFFSGNEYIDDCTLHTRDVKEMPFRKLSFSHHYHNDYILMCNVLQCLPFHLAICVCAISYQAFASLLFDCALHHIDDLF